MKRFKKKSLSISKKINTKQTLSDRKNSLGFLNNAWNNLPYDVTVEERVIFIEITERILKAYNRIRRIYLEDENKRKN